MTRWNCGRCGYLALTMPYEDDPEDPRMTHTHKCPTCGEQWWLDEDTWTQMRLREAKHGPEKGMMPMIAARPLRPVQLHPEVFFDRASPDGFVLLVSDVPISGSEWEQVSALACSATLPGHE